MSNTFPSGLIGDVVSFNYRRRLNGSRESWHELCVRTIDGIAKIGKFTDEEKALVFKMQKDLKTLTSGRWLWVGGTEWVDKPENFAGAYNCQSSNIVDWDSFGYSMNFGMMGTGTGGVLEDKYISQLPTIRNQLTVKVVGEIGTVPPNERQEDTLFHYNEMGDEIVIVVGDSRKGWVTAYQAMLELSSVETISKYLDIAVDLSNVRPLGERLKGFGGIANPVKLSDLFAKLANITNKAIGRKLTSVECCLLLDEAALVVVAGGIRRTASMKQSSSTDKAFEVAKENLWQCIDGKWRVDPERDALRMSNHTRVFHTKPSQDDVTSAVRKQYYSGEGAIQWAGEAIARANADLLDTEDKKTQFISLYNRDPETAKTYLSFLDTQADSKELDHRMSRYGLNPCGEIAFSDGFCNLSEVHLNQLDPYNLAEQYEAFRAATLSVCALLNHDLSALGDRFAYSREIDPIIGVSFTGLFDFFVNLFGRAWLDWWAAGRPAKWGDIEVFINKPDNTGLFELLEADYQYLSDYFKESEAQYLQDWSSIVETTAKEYCDRHGLRLPNRCTTVQPAGSKSLITGASAGWHPPIAHRFIRRVTKRVNDPIALAAISLGYSVVPSQTDKDENGNLLNDPYDPRCTEWLIEIPYAMAWADIADGIDFNFSALAQFDFYMQVQQHYTTHNTSATISLRESEIEPLANAIYGSIQNDTGYISAALLARFDENETFPRLPFEAIDKATYETLITGVKKRQVMADFNEALSLYDNQADYSPETSACEGIKCELGGAIDEAKQQSKGFEIEVL
jgi:ribonucleotide reductase class II